MLIKVVRNRSNRDPKWFDKVKGKVFKVTGQTDNGHEYEVDMSPIGLRGDRSWFKDTEIEETNEVREQMTMFIRANFKTFLGKDMELLDQPDGLDKLQAKYGFKR